MTQWFLVLGLVILCAGFIVLMLRREVKSSECPCDGCMADTTIHPRRRFYASPMIRCRFLEGRLVFFGARTGVPY